MVQLFPSNLGFNACIPVQGITVGLHQLMYLYSVKILKKLFHKNVFLKYLFYSKFYLKTISESCLKLSDIYKMFYQK